MPKKDEFDWFKPTKPPEPEWVDDPVVGGGSTNPEEEGAGVLPQAGYGALQGLQNLARLPGEALDAAAQLPDLPSWIYEKATGKEGYNLVDDDAATRLRQTMNPIQYLPEAAQGPAQKVWEQTLPGMFDKFTNTDMQFPEPVGTAENISRGIGEVAGESALPGMMLYKGAKYASQLANPTSKISKAAKWLGTKMHNSPGKVAVGETTSAVGAGTGLGLAREADYGPGGQVLAMLAGGFTPTGIRAMFSLPPMRTIKKAGKGIGNALMPHETIRGNRVSDMIAPKADAKGVVAAVRRKAAKSYENATSDQYQATLRAAAKKLQESINDVSPAKVQETQEILRRFPELEDQYNLSQITEQADLVETSQDVAKRLENPKLINEQIAARQKLESTFEELKETKGPQAEYDPEAIVASAQRDVDAERLTITNKSDELADEQAALAQKLKDDASGQEPKGQSVRQQVVGARDEAYRVLREKANSLGLNERSSKIRFQPLANRIAEAYRKAAGLRTNKGKAGTQEHPFIQDLQKDYDTASVSDLIDISKRLHDEHRLAQRGQMAGTLDPGKANYPKALSAAINEVDKIIDDLSTDGLAGWSKKQALKVNADADDVVARASSAKQTLKDNPEPRSLLSWLVKAGGLNDTKGEVAHLIGVNKKTGKHNPKAYPKLIRKDGKGGDISILEKDAVEAGYLQEGDSILDKIADELGGNKVYSKADGDQVFNRAEAQDILDELDRMGVDYTQSDDVIRAAYKADNPSDQIVTKPHLAKAYKEFKKAWEKDYVEPFKKGAASDILAEGPNGPKVKDVQVVERFFKAKDTDAIKQFKKIFGGETDELHSGAMNLMYDSVFVKGEVSLDAIKKFQKKYREILKHTPKLTRKIKKYEDAVRTMGESKARQLEQMKAVDSNVLAKQLKRLGKDDPDKFLDGVLQDKNRMKALVNAVPEAQRESFMRGVWDKVLQNGNPMEFFDKHRSVIESALGHERALDLNYLLRGIEKMEMVQLPTRKLMMNTGSTTAAKFEEFWNMSLNSMSARIFAAKSGRTSFRYIALDAAGRAWRGFDKRQADDMIMRAMIDKDFAKVLTDTMKGKMTPTKFVKMHTYMVAAGITRSADKSDKKSKGLDDYDWDKHEGK